MQTGVIGTECCQEVEKASDISTMAMSAFMIFDQIAELQSMKVLKT